MLTVNVVVVQLDPQLRENVIENFDQGMKICRARTNIYRSYIFFHQIRTYKDYTLKKCITRYIMFKNDDFDIEDRPSGEREVFQNVPLEALNEKTS